MFLSWKCFLVMFPNRPLPISVALIVPTNHTLIFENYEEDLESDPSASMILSRNFEKSYLQMAAGWKGWLDKHMPNCKRKEKFKERVDLVILSCKGTYFIDIFRDSRTEIV